MSTQFAVLEAEALKLPPEERALLADHLLASLGAQGEVEQAWATEVERRLAAIEAGQPMQERRKLLAAAEEQAQALYARAARAWNQQGAGKRERAAWDRLLVSLGRLGGHDDLIEAIGREMLGNVRKASA